MSSRKPKKGEKILKKMVDLKNKKSGMRTYTCHGVSPYGDGYGDTQYGDRSD